MGRPVICGSFVSVAEEHPEAADRDEEEQGGVEESDEAGEDSERGPAGGGLRGGGWYIFWIFLAFAYGSDAQGDCDEFREEEGGDGHVPDPADSVLHGGGMESPEPAGPESDLSCAGGAEGLEAADGDLVDDGRGGGGEDAIDGEDDPGGLCSVDAEDLEDAGDEERIERGSPGGGAGVAGEGVREAVAGGEGAGDATHLPAELEVVLAEADAVGVGEGEVEDSDEEADPEHRRWGLE